MIKRFSFAYWFLCLFIFLSSLIILLSFMKVGKDQDVPPFFVDEAHKLAESHYWDIVSNLDIHNPSWNDDFYARTNPPFPKYVLGIALMISRQEIDHQQLQHYFEKLWKTPHLLRKHIQDSALLTARRMSVLFAALTCVMLFLIGFELGSTIWGVLSALLLLINPYFIYHGLIGLHDSLFLFLFTAICMVTINRARVLNKWFAEEQEKRDLSSYIRVCLFYQLLPAAIIAMTASTRINGGLAFVVYAAGIALSIYGWPSLGGKGSRATVTLMAILSAGLLAYTMFLAINPYYYSSPLHKTFETIRVYKDWIVKQQIDPGGGLFTIRERIAAVGYGVLRSHNLPLHILFGKPGILITIATFTGGIFFLVANLIHAKSEVNKGSTSMSPVLPDRAAAASILSWTLICIFGTALWLPLHWTRYLLVPILGSSVLCVVGLAAFINLISGRIWSRIASSGGSSIARGSAVLISLVTLTITLGFTSWVITPAMLEPKILGDDGSYQTEQIYANALNSYPQEALVYRNHALTLISQQRYYEAEKQLTKALLAINKNNPLEISESVQLFHIYADLARMKMKKGDYSGALAAKSAQINIIMSLKEKMASSDPFVKLSYDKSLDDIRDEIRSLNVIDNMR